MKRNRRSLWAELHRDQVARVRAGAAECSRTTPDGDGALVALAEARVRRRLWLCRTLPLHLLFLAPGLLFVGTRSRLVLILFIAAYPLLFVVRAVLARLLAALIGPEEVLVRREYERLRARGTRAV